AGPPRARVRAAERGRAAVLGAVFQGGGDRRLRDRPQHEERRRERRERYERRGERGAEERDAEEEQQHRDRERRVDEQRDPEDRREVEAQALEGGVEEAAERPRAEPRLDAHHGTQTTRSSPSPGSPGFNASRSVSSA